MEHGMVTFAGVSRKGGKLKFRSSNRDNYAFFLKADGQTDIDIRKLPAPMTKEGAREYMLTVEDFAVNDEVKGALGPKAPVAKSTEPKKRGRKSREAVAASAVTESAEVPGGEDKSEDEIEAIRARNLEVIRQVAAQNPELTVATPEIPEVPVTEDEEDITSFVPKFLLDKHASE